MPSSHFDPTWPQLKSQLTSKLGLSPNAAVEPMNGHRGGLNEGVWIVRDHAQSFVMKLVKGSNSRGMPTEAERLFKLHNEHPSMINDMSLAFPVKIFRCAAPGIGKRFDLIVMRKAPGTLLATLIAHMVSEGKTQQIMKILEHLGRFLADFHSRYGNKQHNDFQPSNIFCDPATQRFTLIDVSDVGPKVPLAEADCERFIASLSLLSKCFGQNFYHDGKRHFEAGYQRGRKN